MKLLLIPDIRIISMNRMSIDAAGLTRDSKIKINLRPLKGSACEFRQGVYGYTEFNRVI